MHKEGKVGRLREEKSATFVRSLVTTPATVVVDEIIIGVALDPEIDTIEEVETDGEVEADPEEDPILGHQ